MFALDNNTDSIVPIMVCVCVGVCVVWACVVCVGVYVGVWCVLSLRLLSLPSKVQSVTIATVYMYTVITVIKVFPIERIF